MKKMLLFAVAAFAAVSLAANPLNGWIPTQSDLRPKNPDMIKTAADSITLSGIPAKSWILFNANKVDAKKGQTVEITVTASGKGKVDIGFYEYKSGFSITGLNVKQIALTDKAEEQKIVIPVKYAETTLLRPVIRIAPDSQIVVSKYALTVAK
jgi:hypothetical protein